MTITAANVEANGWVLALTINASLGSFASYTLDPDGTPRVVLSTTHSGFSVVSGMATSITRSRVLVGTMPLRKVANVIGINLQPFVIDEVSLGGGSILVRVALSEFIYASDSGLSLSVLANWRSGSPAQTISVSNNSTVAVPIPIMRWIDVPYQRNTNGQIKLSMVAFSHHPLGVAPVAAVKFTITDGSNVKTAWATVLSSSTTYGDQPRAYEVTMDVTAAPALTAGLLRCDAEIYPWIGAMRPTDVAGTKSMTALGTEGYKSAAAAAYVVAYDPAGTRYSTSFIAVDAATGSGSAAAVTVGASWAAAKAGTRANSIAVAVQAGYLANRSLAAANGQPAKSRSVDGLTIGLLAGTQAGPGNSTVTSGITADESWLNIIGDPDDANPRANCILQTATAAISPRISRWQFNLMTLEVGTNGLVLSAPTYWWFDNVEIRGKTGVQTGTTSMTSVTPPAGFASLWATRSRFWKYGIGWKYNGSGTRPGLIRACETTRRMEALCIISNRWIEHLDTSVTASTGDQCCAAWGLGATSAGGLGNAEDFVVLGNDFRSSNDKIVSWGKVSAATAGTTLDSVRRNVFINNLCERKTTTTGSNFWACGENESLEISYNILEGNTTVGERETFGFNDPLSTSLVTSDTLNNIAYVNRRANNAHDFTSEKDDNYDDPDSKSARNTAGDPRGHGYRTQTIGCWSITFGVGFEGNYDAGRYPTGPGIWPFRYFGRNSLQLVGGDALYTTDNSAAVTGIGQGNYKPTSASPLIGRARSANVDRDVFGAVRSAGSFSAGAVEGQAQTDLVPLGAISATASGSPALAWFGLFAPASSEITTASTEAILGWFASLSPDGSTNPTSAAMTMLASASWLFPDKNDHPHTVEISVVGEAFSLDPADTMHALSDAGVILIPENIAALVRTLIVSGELRIVYVPLS